MYRLLIALLILIFCLKSDAQVTAIPDCDFSLFPKDAQGCVSLTAFRNATTCSIPQGTCFAVQAISVGKEPFSNESPEERKKILAILDSSALALLKNSSLSNVNIVFFDKGGKFSPDFKKEAEQYLVDKGVKSKRFNIKVVDKVVR